VESFIFASIMPEAITSTSFFVWIVISILICIIIVLMYRLKRGSKKSESADSDEKLRQLQSKVESLELRTIHHTLNPHLFKNTLNAIQSHAFQTYYALDKLANVLDYILYESNREFVTIRQEIDFALNLIEINRMKVSPLFDLRVKQEINKEESSYHKLAIAPLICVDLIENAFKHADVQKEDAFISILFQLRNGEFILTVSNKISRRPAIKKDNSGLGKENLRRRLEIIYKNNFVLTDGIEDDVYIAQLKLKLHEHQAKMPATG
jgi:LytS/YehU family sensor histidine kinase